MEEYKKKKQEKNIKYKKENNENNETDQNSIGIYIHIPFCRQKCTYCDFYSKKVSSENKENDKETEIEKYVQALIKQIRCEYILKDIKLNLEKIVVDTIFIGGGTPSILKATQIDRILKEIYKKYNVAKNVEISIESNPESITEEKVVSYVKSGINRISMGLQTADNRLLKVIGRVHDYNRFKEAIQIARKYFKNINVDLMYGLPTQDAKMVEDTITKVVLEKPTHISLYSLIISKNTKIYSDISKGKYAKCDLKTEEEQLKIAQKLLKENGYIGYEVSNYAKKGYECKHNLNCWRQKNYIGYGVSASSYIGNIRYTNISDISKYIEFFNYKEQEKENEKEKRKKEKKQNKQNKNEIYIIEEKQNFKEYIIEKNILNLRTKYGIIYYDDILENILKWDKEFNTKKENIGLEKEEFNKEELIEMVSNIVKVLEKYVAFKMIKKVKKNNQTKYIFTQKGKQIQNMVYVDILDVI